MDLNLIDGTVESLAVRKAGSKVVIYDHLAFRLADGSGQRLDKVAVAPPVAALLRPGAQGRFYAYKAIDHKGLMGARLRGGASAFAMPSGNEQIMMMVALIGTALLAVVFLNRDALSVLGLLMAVLGGFAWWSYRRLRTRARARYDDDQDSGGTHAV